MTRIRAVVAACLVVALSGIPLARPASAGAVSGRCDQAPARDKSGDGDIDIESIRLTSNCRRVQFTVTTHNAFTNDQLDTWAVFLGPGTACYRMKQVVLVTNEPGKGLTGGLYLLTDNCRIGANPIRKVAVERLSSTSLRMTLGEDTPGLQTDRAYTWYSVIWSTADKQSDAAPRFPIAVFPPMVTPRVSLTSAHDGRSITARWSVNDSVDRFELQYRVEGGTWSATQSIDPLHPYAVFPTTPGTRYEARVRAATGDRRTPWGTSTVTAIGIPGPVRNVTIEHASNGFIVSFDPPASNGGSPIREYTVFYEYLDLGEFPCSIQFSARRCQITGVGAGGTLTIRASNKAGRNGPIVAYEVTELPPP